MCYRYIFLISITQIIRFGIDLVGGTLFTLEVKTDVAIQAELVEKNPVNRSKIKRERSIILSKTIQDQKITLTFENPQQTQEATRI